MSNDRARGFLPPKLVPACGADKESSERPSIDGLSRPGGETILTPSTDSIDASSPALSSLDASLVTTRRCRADAGASASSTALSALRRPAALALAAASPVGAGACSATAARSTSIPAAQWCYGAPRTSLLPRNARCQQHSGLQGFTVAQQCAIATKLRVMIRLWRGAATTTHLRREPSRKATFCRQWQTNAFHSGDGCCGFDLDGLAAVRTLQLQPSEEEDYEARRRFLGKNATRPGGGRAVDECTITPTWTSPAS